MLSYRHVLWSFFPVRETSLWLNHWNDAETTLSLIFQGLLLAPADVQTCNLQLLPLLPSTDWGRHCNKHLLWLAPCSWPDAETPILCSDAQPPQVLNAAKCCWWLACSSTIFCLYLTEGSVLNFFLLFCGLILWCFWHIMLIMLYDLAWHGNVWLNPSVESQHCWVWSCSCIHVHHLSFSSDKKNILVAWPGNLFQFHLCDEISLTWKFLSLFEFLCCTEYKATLN